MEKKKLSAVKLLFFLCEIAAKDFRTPAGIFKTNCFLDEAENECESAITRIGGVNYGCDMVIDLDFSIQKIGLVDNQILVYGGNSVTYAIDEVKEEVRVVQKVIPPFENLFDLHNNTYFLANGSNYIILNGTGQLKEIRAGNKSLNQLAIDVYRDRLFILKPREKENADPDNRGGDFYILALFPNILYSPSIMAELDKVRRHVTAISTQNGKLLLGLRTVNDTGKLIRLKSIPILSSPCNIDIKSDIRSLNKVYVEFVARLCEHVASNLTASSPFYNATLNSMMTENTALQIKLNEAESNCKTPEKPRSQITRIGSRSTRDVSPEDEIVYSAPNWPPYKRKRDDIEVCQPAYRIQLDNSNLKARLRLMTKKFDSLLSSIDALNQEFEEKPVPNAEEEESDEPAYRRPKTCLEAYQLNALTDGIERLEQVGENLRQKLLEYTAESMNIIAEENPSPEEEYEEEDE